MKEIKEENNCDNINKNNNEMEKQSIKWTAVLFYIYLHVFGLAGLYILFVKAKWATVFYCEYRKSYTDSYIKLDEKLKNRIYRIITNRIYINRKIINSLKINSFWSSSK